MSDETSDDKLDSILGIEKQVDEEEDESKKHTPVKRASAPPVQHNDENPDEDAKDDYKFTRAKLHELIDKGTEALDGVLEVAQDSDHPRAYEVVSVMLKNTGDLTDKLMQLQKDRQEVSGKKPDKNEGENDGGQHVHFHGSTQELMEEIERRREEKNKE